MNQLLTIILLTLAGVQALGKVQIPFQKISLMSVYEIETKVQTPMAVAPSRFSAEVAKDCREFSSTMLLLQNKSVQIQKSDYDEMRLRALALSMKPSYEIQILAAKFLNLEPAFETAKITKYSLMYDFADESLSFQTVRENVNSYVVAHNSEQQDYLLLQFKSRDLFCDYYFGNLKIYLKSEMQLETNSLLQYETEQKLQKVLNHLNDSFKLSAHHKIQAAYLGASVGSDFKNNWKESLKVIFTDLVSKEDLLPLTFWSQKQSDFYSLNFGKLHNISEQKILLKGNFNE